MSLTEAMVGGSLARAASRWAEAAARRCEAVTRGQPGGGVWAVGR
jgi:hypothetical protein